MIIGNNTHWCYTIVGRKHKTQKFNVIYKTENMRKLIIPLFTIIFGLNCYGQKISEPLYYLNSKQIDLKKVYLNPMRLDSIDIQKKTQNGEVYMFTKNRQFSFCRLTDVLKNYTNLNGFNDSIIFKINGNLINDTTSIIIDDTYFVYVTVDKLFSVKYISKQFCNLMIVNVDLETKKRDPVINIRGNNDIIDKLKK